MVDDIATSIDDQCLRDGSLRSHKYASHFLIGPTQNEAKASVANELKDLRGRPSIIHGQCDKLDVLTQVVFPNLFILGYLSPAWSTPARPEIDDHNLAGKIREPKTVVIK